MVVGSPLEDARHLAKRYERVRQEAETQVNNSTLRLSEDQQAATPSSWLLQNPSNISEQLTLWRRLVLYVTFSFFLVLFWPRQVIDVARCQAKVRETNTSLDNISKLEAAERRLHELKSNMSNLGKEAAAAMSAVEGQQQRLTLQRLIAMVYYFGSISFSLFITSFIILFSIFEGWSWADLSSACTRDTQSARVWGTMLLRKPTATSSDLMLLLIDVLSRSCTDVVCSSTWRGFSHFSCR